MDIIDQDECFKRIYHSWVELESGGDKIKKLPMKLCRESGQMEVGRLGCWGLGQVVVSSSSSSLWPRGSSEKSVSLGALSESPKYKEN